MCTGQSSRLMADSKAIANTPTCSTMLAFTGRSSRKNGCKGLSILWRETELELM